MKVFISGQLADAARVRQYMDTVEAAGHSVTHDWTSSDVFLASREAKLANITEASIRASKDISGVVECDVYVLISDNESMGKGMYVELGAALALNERLKVPEIYIVGQLNHLSVFYLHPAVHRVDTMDAVLKAMNQSI